MAPKNRSHVDQDFRQLYEGVRKKHEELAPVSEEALDFLSHHDLAERRQEETGIFLFVSTVLPPMYVVTWMSLVLTWRLATGIAQRWSVRDYRAMLQAAPGLQVASLVGLIAVLSYFFVIPIISYGLKKGWLKVWPFPGSSFRNFQNIDCTSPRFVSTTVLTTWTALGWTIVTIASAYRPASVIVERAFRLWLGVPVILLSLVPLALVTIVIGLAVAWKRSRSATTSADVLRRLLTTLSGWPDATGGKINIAGFQDQTARRLCRIASQIRRLKFGLLPHNKQEEWVAHQFALAADNLLVCANWLYLPQVQSTEAVRSRLIVFSNAFLTGHLDDLPRGEVTEFKELSPYRGRRRLSRTILLTLAVFTYCAAPFAAFLILRHGLASLSIPDSVWLLLYSLWLAVGLYAYLEHTSQGAAEILLGLVKAVLGK
jgi:hypothetical protein